MDFGEVLGKAWRIIWKHKVLWIFGILAGCARGGGGGGTGGGSGWRQEQPYPGVSMEFQHYIEQAGDWVANHVWLVVAVAVVVLLLVVLGIFLGTIGRIGLIRGASKADAGAERLDFGELFQGSLPFFWRVFGLSLLIGLVFLVGIMILVAPAIALGAVTSGVGLLCGLPLICILIPLMWIAGIVVQQANQAMVIENLGLTAGVRRGWQVLKQNVGSLLIIWLIVTIIGVVVAFVIALPIIVAVVPAAIAAAMGSGRLAGAPLIIGGICLTLYLPVLLVANGILTAYLESVWTLTYLRLTRSREEQSPTAVIPANA